MQLTFSLEESREWLIPPVSGVELLLLLEASRHSRKYYSYLMNGLLCYCHPILLYVQENSHPGHINFIKVYILLVLAVGQDRSSNDSIWTMHICVTWYLILPILCVFQFLYQKLIWREENPRCCGNRNIKCWRHYLKSVKIQSIAGTKIGRCFYDEDSWCRFEDLEEVEEATFELQW